MALSHGIVVFFLLLLVVAEIGTSDAKSTFGKETVNTLMMDKEEKEEEKEKEDESHCLSQSRQFKGFCLSSDTCAEVCKSESFPGGECKLENAIRKCFCKKPC